MEKRIEARKLKKQEEAKREERQRAQMEEARSTLTLTHCPRCTRCPRCPCTTSHVCTPRISAHLLVLTPASFTREQLTDKLDQSQRTLSTLAITEQASHQQTMDKLAEARSIPTLHP